MDDQLSFVPGDNGGLDRRARAISAIRTPSGWPPAPSHMDSSGITDVTETRKEIP